MDTAFAAVGKIDGVVDGHISIGLHGTGHGPPWTQTLGQTAGF